MIFQLAQNRHRTIGIGKDGESYPWRETMIVYCSSCGLLTPSQFMASRRQRLRHLWQVPWGLEDDEICWLRLDVVYGHVGAIHLQREIYKPWLWTTIQGRSRKLASWSVGKILNQSTIAGPAKSSLTIFGRNADRSRSTPKIEAVPKQNGSPLQNAFQRGGTPGSYNGRIHACMHACMDVWMYVCMHVCRMYLLTLNVSIRVYK